MLKGLGRKLILLVALLVVVAVAAVVLLLNNLAPIIERSTEYVLQVDTSVDSASVGLTDQRVTIEGMSIGNPSNYDASQAMSFGEITAQVDIASFKGDEPTIRLIRIADASITVERDGREFNLQRLINSAARLGGSGEEAPPDAPEGAQKNYRIERVELLSPQVQVTLPGASGRTIPIDLGDVIVEDIGTGNRVSLAEAIQEVLVALLESIVDAGVAIPDLQDLMGDLEGQLDALEGQMRDQLQSIEGQADQIQGQADQIREEAEGALDNVREGIGGLLNRNSDEDN
jgi:hypothetical protein